VHGEAVHGEAVHGEAVHIEAVHIEAVHIEVVDDGSGLPEAYRAGVGLSSIRERAGELGGTATVSVGTGGGTVVRARLPLPRGDRRDAPVTP
jgi:signal transduction histidine kinase